VLDVLVDSGAARENVTRLAENRGWSVSVKEKEGEFLLTLKRQ
jgi:TusA-related sulfurtransferase